jgi:hypothetical protein
VVPRLVSPGVFAAVLAPLPLLASRYTHGATVVRPVLSKPLSVAKKFNKKKDFQSYFCVLFPSRLEMLKAADERKTEGMASFVIMVVWGTSLQPSHWTIALRFCSCQAPMICCRRKSTSQKTRIRS